MSVNMDFVKDIISKPKILRKESELETLVSVFKKRSPLLSKLERGVLMDIGKNCTYHKATRDDIIIKQGEKGNAFYIILSGTVSVYIDPRMTGEDDGHYSPVKQMKTMSPDPSTPEPESIPPMKSRNSLAPLAEEEEDGEGVVREAHKVRKPAPKKLAVLDRSKFGKFIVKYEQGKAFGEVALVKRESFRNASIIADEDVDLLVIGQELFDRSLKTDHEREFAEINTFIETHPFFSHMPNKMKKLLEMSLRRETFIFDTVMIKQGDPVIGLHFIIKGQANVTVEPHKHQKQYNHLWPFEAGIDIYSVEFEHLREARRQAILRKYEDPAVWETKSEELVIRRTEGYAAVEKRMKERHVELCSIQDREVLGDVETLNNLSTYMHTVKCTANTEVFILDNKNYERIVGKRNLATLEIMREYVKAKLQTRMEMKQGHLIPFLKFLHYKMTEESLPQAKPLPPLKTSKTLPDRETMLQQLLQWFKDGKSTIVEPFTPGAVFYKELMKEKAAARREQAVTSGTKTPTVGVTLRANKRNQPARKPRSLMEIRESLRQMMEAEVIQIENDNAKKQIGSRRKAKGKAKGDLQPLRRRRNSKAQSNLEGSRSKATSLNSLTSLPDYLDNSPHKHSEDSLFAILAKTNEPPKNPESTPKSEKRQGVSNGEHKNVLVTEVAKKDNHGDLPNIKEERTQEEILLRQEKDHQITQKENTEEYKHKDISSKQSFPSKATSKSYQSETLDSVSTLIGNEDSKNLELPKIEDKQPRKLSLNTDSSPSKWSTAIKFVNENIQRRLTEKKDPDDLLPQYDDYEANDKSLSFLENRLMAFHVKYGGKAKMHMKLPKLARYTLNENDINAPKPGGKVWIRRRMCRFADNKIQVKDHKHVRHHIIADIPDFESVRKQKQVMQALL